MKRTWIGTTVALAATLLASAPAAVAAQSGGINGSWVSVDFDGSNQTLEINGSGAYRSMQLFDDEATQACDGGPAWAQGAGRLDGDTLLAFATVICRPGGNVVRGQIPLGFTYDAGTDTITDDAGIVWYRD